MQAIYLKIAVVAGVINRSAALSVHYQQEKVGRWHTDREFVEETIILPNSVDTFRLINKAEQVEGRVFLEAQTYDDVKMSDSTKDQSRWTMEKGQDGWLRLKNTDYDALAGRLFLTAHVEEPMRTWTGSAGEDSWWHMEPAGGGWFRLRNQDTHGFLSAADPEDVTAATENVADDNAAFLWKFLPLGQAAESPSGADAGKSEMQMLESRAQEADRLHEKVADLRQKANSIWTLKAQLAELNNISLEQQGLEANVTLLRGRVNSSSSFAVEIAELETKAREADHLQDILQTLHDEEYDAKAMQEEINKLEEKKEFLDQIETGLPALKVEAGEVDALEERVQTLESEIAESESLKTTLEDQEESPEEKVQP